MVWRLRFLEVRFIYLQKSAPRYCSHYTRPLLIAGGFVRGPQEVGIWDYVAALPSPPSESALPTPPQGGAIQSEEVERLKRLLKEKESECERWGDVNRKLVKRLKKSSS